jgi:orotidine-5'-phosphate decarboxylase
MKHKSIPLNERIIFALDVSSYSEAEKWINRLGSHVKFFKVGLQLFIAEGWHVIDMITQRGYKVMCDLKLFDIPETVKLALRELKKHNVSFTTVHGNDPILRAAMEEKNHVKILSVTVLTSFGEEDIKETGFKGTVEDLVCIRAKRAIDMGCDGVVSSGLEALRLRKELGENFIIVTPGIRPGKNIEAHQDDQKRIISAQQAIQNGADHIVVGRPIREAEDPLAVVESMQNEIQMVLSS